MTHYEGRVARGDGIVEGYPGARSLATAAVTMWPALSRTEESLHVFDVEDALVTNGFVVADPRRSLLFLDQSYAGIETLVAMRFALDGDRFRLDSDPISLPGRHVILGGPIDGVWYHWLFNWCPRLLVLRRLRPDLFDDPAVRFVVHPLALKQPFRAILDTFGIPEGRLLPITLDRDHRLDQATLISFLDQRKLYPEIVRAFADHLIASLAVTRDEASPKRIFASRQGLAAPKRRIHNFEEIAPILDAFHIRVEALGERGAREQAILFHDADLVIGAHGSDLSNILFCRPGTVVIVIESQFSVDATLHRGLETLAEILGLHYRMMISATLSDETRGEASTIQKVNRDYVIDPSALEAALADATAGRG